MASFDPLHKWLGIPPEQQPASYYRLLGIPELESDPDVIDGAAEQRTIYLRTFRGGDQAALAEHLLNEVSAARICLLNAEQKASYDQQLQAAQVQNNSRGIGSEQRAMPAWSPPIQKFSPGRKPTQAIWQQPLKLAAAGGLVAMIVLLLVLNSGGDKPAPARNAQETTTAELDQQRKVPDKNTKDERDAEVNRLVEERVKEELLKTEQERLAERKVEEEKAEAAREVERRAKEKAAVKKAERDQAEFEREFERRVEEKTSVLKAEAEKAAADREAKGRAEEIGAAMKAEAEKAALERESERLDKELADSKAKLPKTTSSAADLTGKWRSSETGSVIQFKQQGNIIRVSVVSSPTVSSIEGVITLTGTRMKSTSYTFVFKKDPRKTKFRDYVSGRILSDGSLSFSIPTVFLNKNGDLLRRGRMTARYTREK